MPTPIALRVRNLETYEDGVVSFETEGEASAWLIARPRYVDVLGPASAIPDDVATRLRAAIRPLDAEERALEQILEQRKREAMKAAAAEQQARLDEIAAAERRAVVDDPNAPMRIRWTYDGGMEIVDKDDPRPIPPEARAAVLAWIRERDEWVEGRGQMVGDARCTVGKGVVLEGTFVPVTAAPKTPAS